VIRGKAETLKADPPSLGWPVGGVLVEIRWLPLRAGQGFALQPPFLGWWIPFARRVY